MDFKIFSVEDEYIVAMTMEEAVANHLTRVEGEYYGEEGPDVEEISFDDIGVFEQEGSYAEMTFAEFLGDFTYTGPQLICWRE
jgi:hypothetical protein